MDCQATLYFDIVASNSYLSVSCIIAQRDEQGKKILKTPLVFLKLTVFSYLVVLSLRVRLLRQGLYSERGVQIRCPLNFRPMCLNPYIFYGLFS